MDGPLATWLQRIERGVLQSTSGFIVGHHITAADAALASFLTCIQSGLFDHVPPSYLERFPALLAHQQCVLEHGPIASYLAARRGSK